MLLPEELENYALKEKRIHYGSSYKKLLCTDSILPRIYALPKV